MSMFLVKLFRLLFLQVCMMILTVNFYISSFKCFVDVLGGVFVIKLGVEQKELKRGVTIPSKWSFENPPDFGHKIRAIWLNLPDFLICFNMWFRLITKCRSFFSKDQ